MKLYIYNGFLSAALGLNGFVVEESFFPENPGLPGALLVHVATTHPDTDDGFSLGVYRGLKAYVAKDQPTKTNDGDFWVNQEDLVFLANGDESTKNGMHGSQFDDIEIEERKPVEGPDIYQGRGEVPEGSIRITPEHGPAVYVPEDRFILTEGTNSFNKSPEGHSLLLFDRYANGDASTFLKFKDWTRLSEEMLEPENLRALTPYIAGAVFKDPLDKGFYAMVPPTGEEGMKPKLIGLYPRQFKAICELMTYYMINTFDFPGKKESHDAVFDFHFSKEFLNTEFKSTVH